MSHSKIETGITTIVKAMVVTSLRLLVMALAFICRIAGLILTKLSELFEKASGHVSH
jgi:hypothetical protein